MSEEKAVMEGNMLGEDAYSSSDESNDSENEESYQHYYDELDRAQVGQANNEDDDEEEIEVFDGRTAKTILSQAKSFSATPMKSETSTVTAEPVVNKSVSKFEEKKEEKVEFTAVVNDEFGINYKRFDINALMEDMELLNNQATVVTQKQISSKSIVDDDDEFAVFENEDQSQIHVAIQQALNTAKRHEETMTINEDNVDFSDVMPIENTIAAILQETHFPAQLTASSLDEPVIIGNDDHTKHASHNKLPMSGTESGAAITGSHGSYAIANEAKKAFDDIVGVYGNGMGDQELLLLDMMLHEQDKKLEQQEIGNLDVILEADEDEEEEEESEKDSVQPATSTTSSTTAAPTSVSAASKYAVKSKAEQEFDDFIQKEAEVSTAESTGTKMSSTAAEEKKFTRMSFDLVTAYFATLDYTPYEDKIILYEEPSSSSSFSIPKLFGGGNNHKKLSYPNSEEELRFVFHIAQIDYNPMIEEHLNMLCTIYNSLLKVNIRNRHDPHLLLKGIDERWENIGFQGRDPMTDLNRSMKMLSVVQILHFLETNPSLAHQLFVLSESANRQVIPRGQFDPSWPFMCVAVMFTRESLQLLRTGVLYEQCNKAKNVMDVVCQYHHACFAEFGRLLLKEPTKHHALHLATLREVCAKSPLKIMKEYSASYLLPIKNTNASTGKKEVKDDFSKEKLTNLDALEDLGEPSATANDDNSNESGWSNLFFKSNSKASKFAV